MMKSIRLFALGLTLSLAALPVAAPAMTAAEARTAEQVRKEIVTLPFLSIFDDIRFSFQDGVVTLMGDVHRPTLKKSAERVALRVEGVNRVENKIQILPLSRFDNQIRLQVARALYSHPALDRYGMGALPSIRIIVNNGDVTLKGFVNREMEKNVAGIVANQVHGVFSVTNDLQVEYTKKI